MTTPLNGSFRLQYCVNDSLYTSAGEAVCTNVTVIVGNANPTISAVRVSDDDLAMPADGGTLFGGSAIPFQHQTFDLGAGRWRFIRWVRLNGTAIDPETSTVN